MFTITGDVCYRSKTLSLHSNYFRYGSLEGTSIVFLNETDKKSEPVTIKVADLIAFYNKVNRAVSGKIILDLQRNRYHLNKCSVAKIVYEELWLYFPQDPEGLKGILNKSESTIFSIMKKILQIEQCKSVDSDR